MKKQHLLLFALIAAALAGCREKERIIPIKGRVVEYGTNTPVPGASLLMMCYDGAFLGAPSATKLEEIITGPDGSFSREYPADKLCGGAFIIAYKNGYYKKEIDFADSGVQGDIVLDPEAWLNVIAIPDKGGEGIGIDGSFLGFGYYAYAKNGIRSDTFLSRGNRKENIYWYPTGYIEQVKNDSIYLKSHKITSYELHY